MWYQAVFGISCVVFSAKRLLFYLRYLQQENYSAARFLRWCFQKRAFDKRGSAILAASVVLSWFSVNGAFLAASFFLLLRAYWEEDPRKSGKVRLTMTPRSRRIATLACLIYLLIQAALLLAASNKTVWLAQIALVQSIPLILAASVWGLAFDENRRQQAFYRDAKRILAKVRPYVIGITGSYGKTSTKHALAALLNTTYGPAFFPVKGINTEMGIVREIREGLTPGISYAVIEMAAYQEGSIARLCKLTPPDAAIITAVGVAHLERFGDEAAVLRAKAELAEAVPSTGILVCNGDNRGARTIAERHKKKTTLLYGFDNSSGDLDCWIVDYRQELRHTSFSLMWNNRSYQAKCALFGKAAVSNIAASFAMAAALGADPAFLAAAISNIKAPDNRLQVVVADEVTYLRDAYNSNPEGFQDALEVLATMKGKRKILITPGMIELASLEQPLHEKIAKTAASACDLAVIVGKTNRESLAKGLMAAGLEDKRLVLVDTREQAFSELKAYVQPGDVVLIENDLPDLYEATLRL